MPPWSRGGALADARLGLVAAAADMGGEGLLPRLDLEVQLPSSGEGFLCEATPGPASSSCNWLLRLGDCGGRRRGGAERHAERQRLSQAEWARHAILTWRLQRPYLIYCCGCAVIMAFLLVWNVVKGMQNNWNLPQWRHHPWEEALEVTVGVLIVTETALTMRVIGVRTFLASWWCVCDLVVALLTAVSIVYGLMHLGRRGEVCEADVPLLLLRFVLQPTRVLAAFAGTCRAQRMQARVDELQVNFDALPLRGGFPNGESPRSDTMAAFEVLEGPG